MNPQINIRENKETDILSEDSSVVMGRGGAEGNSGLCFQEYVREHQKDDYLCHPARNPRANPFREKTLCQII